MTEYTVIWEIQMSANSPEEAAKLALEIQRDEYSEATIFDVRPSNEKKTMVIDAADSSKPIFRKDN